MNGYPYLQKSADLYTQNYVFKILFSLNCPELFDSWLENKVLMDNNITKPMHFNMKFKKIYNFIESLKIKIF